MSLLTPDGLKQACVDAGFEIYRVHGSTIQVAERVRLHLMDSGITISATEPPTLCFRVRAQRSDFPSASAGELFSKVRQEIGESARSRGFSEIDARTREVKDPVDDSHVLDVWHELIFSKDTALDTLVEDIRWAMNVPKCVT